MTEENPLGEGVEKYTQEQIESARAYEAVIREQATTLIDQAVEHFTTQLGYTEGDALQEVALQSLTRSIMLFGLLPQDAQEALKNAPLITEPLPA